MFQTKKSLREENARLRKELQEISFVRSSKPEIKPCISAQCYTCVHGWTSGDSWPPVMLGCMKDVVCKDYIKRQE